MKIIKTFSSGETTVNIMIKGCLDNPIFQASDIGNVLGMTSMKQYISRLSDDEKVFVDEIQKNVFLTDKGVYKILFRSRKPIATTLQNWVYELIREMRTISRTKLEEQLASAKNEIIKNKVTFETEQEQKILQLFNTDCSVVYIARVNLRDDDTFVVKIGAGSNGLQQCFKDDIAKYGENVLILSCFETKQCEDFVSFLINHEQILGYVCDNPDLVLVGGSFTYEMLLQIVIANRKQFNDSICEKMQLNCESLQKIVDSIIIQNNIGFDSLLQNIETTKCEIIAKLNVEQTKSVMNFELNIPKINTDLNKSVVNQPIIRHTTMRGGRKWSFL